MLGVESTILYAAKVCLLLSPCKLIRQCLLVGVEARIVCIVIVYMDLLQD
jgi:hypothetical protein